MFARTKFLAPQPRDTLVARPALIEALRAGDALPLTIVVGSPGSGKSSLLAEWYRQADDGSVAWLAADRGDDDPSRFWRGFIRAVQQVEPAFGVEATDLITLDGRVTTDVLESLLDDDASLDERVRLVIDDFQLVSPAATQHLQHLLERGFVNLRLLLGSRSDPTVGLPRLRLAHRVCEVREADLRLQLPETRELLERLGLDPDSLDVPALQARTEGWAAGVQMAALSVVGADDAASRIRELAGTTQTIAGYLTAEVVANQPAHVQRFLEDTCVADELDAAICESLTEAAAVHPDGTVERVTLEQLEAANLLLTRVDAAGTTFRYHHLFGDMLRHRLRANDPDRFRDQHRRAAEHHERTGDVNAALRHFWQAGRADLGAELLRHHLLAVTATSDAPPPFDISIVPSDEALRAAPANAVGYSAGLLLNGHIQLAASLVRRADRATRHQEVARLDRAHIVSARIATELALGNTAEAVDLTHEFLRMFDADELDADDWVAATLPFAARAAVWEGNMDLARGLLERMSSPRAGNVDRVDALGVLALAAMESGDLATAEGFAGDAVSAAIDLGTTGSGPEIAARAVLGTVLLETSRPTEAEPHFASAVDTIRLERVPSYVLATIGLARLQRSRGHFDGALAQLAQARARVEIDAPGPTLAARLDYAELAVRLALGEVDAAEHLAERLPAGFRQQLAMAWVQQIRRRFDVTAALYEPLLTAARTPRDLFDASLWRLRDVIERGENEATVSLATDEVLDLAHDLGFVFPIAEAGTAVLQTVVASARRRPRDPFVERLLLVQPFPRPADLARPAYGVDELSSRELIVLRYMATSMSNQEIADALYLSVNTVKTHIKHVLRKLGAGSRAEATRRATELHYL